IKRYDALVLVGLPENIVRPLPGRGVGLYNLEQLLDWRGFGGMTRRLGDDDSCVVGLGGFEEILCERQGEVHASVRRGIAREISGVQEYSGPCESLREGHGGIIVLE